MVLCPGVSDPGALAAGHRAHGHRSLPGRHGGGGSEFQSWRSCLLKVSGANEPGEPNGEPTSTGIRPHQATSSHSRGWQMPHWATSSHVWRLYDLVLQARGRRFEPYCAHCEVFTFHEGPCSRLGLAFLLPGACGLGWLDVILCMLRRGPCVALPAWIRACGPAVVVLG